VSQTPLNPLTDAGDFFVTFNAANVERFPELTARVKGFDAGARPASVAATSWLNSIDVTQPQESVTTLYFRDGELVGFYALASGQAELRQKDRKRLGLGRPTQPAVLLTWIAKSAHHDCDGEKLLKDAVYRALKAAEYVAATVLALDPFDEGTAELWQRKYGFLKASPPRPGVALPRLIVPLREPQS
jgi:hypothetical protein